MAEMQEQRQRRNQQERQRRQERQPVRRLHLLDVEDLHQRGEDERAGHQSREVRIDHDEDGPVDVDVVRDRCTPAPAWRARSAAQSSRASFHLSVEIRVVDLRLGVQVRLEHVDLVHALQPRQRAGDAVHVTEHAGLRRTDLDARRQQSFRDAVVAEGALVGGLLLGVQVARAVRAGLDAVAAADAAGIVDQHHTVLGLEGRADGTHLHAGRVGALVAQLRNEEAPEDVLFHHRF